MTQPRRADARRSWRCVRRSCGDVRGIVLAGTISEPRRADARRSRPDVRMCIAKIVFCRQTCALRNKSGGRKPPVGRIRRAGSRRRNSSHCNCKRGLQTHGGLTPAALGAACDGRVGMCAELSSQARFSSHGGLTPAALDRMCVCVSQKSFFRRQTCASRNKSGGRKPPVGCTPHAGSRRRNSPHCRCGLGLQTHGGLTDAAPSGVVR
jgi:hypothetical protein